MHLNNYYCHVEEWGNGNSIIIEGGESSKDEMNILLNTIDEALEFYSTKPKLILINNQIQDKAGIMDKALERLNVKIDKLIRERNEYKKCKQHWYDKYQALKHEVEEKDLLELINDD